MADRRTPKPTGRRVRGYISDLVELSAPRALWTALVYHQDYRDDVVLHAAAERISAFAKRTDIPGLPNQTLTASGVFAYNTGEVRSTRELIGAARKGIGWLAATEWFIHTATILRDCYTGAKLPSHGSLDPHRILVNYSGEIRLVGFGLPRLDLVDFLDDASLLPPTESLRYTAPESLEGAEEDFGTDLFILGLIAARLGGGHQLYTSDDPKALLAIAADGEARVALTRLAPECPALAWLGPVLEPWPEDRPSSIDAAIHAASAVLESLNGDTLAQAMEAHAEIASDVEVDLPRGWTLPVPPPPLDDSHREAGTRRLKRSHGEAQRTLERTLSRLSPLEERDWSLSPSAAESFAEAKRHIKAATDSVAVAATALERATTASTHDALDHALAEGEDATDRARGANAEALRAIERATQTLEVEERAVEERDRTARGEKAAAMVRETEALVSALDTLDARTQAPITSPARATAHALIANLQRFADAPTLPSDLSTLEDELAALRKSIDALEKQADADARAAELAAVEAATQLREQRIAMLDAKIASLQELSSSWDRLLGEARALGTAIPSITALHSTLVDHLRKLTALVGNPDPDETQDRLTELAPELQSGAASLQQELDTLRSERDRADADEAHRERVRAGIEGARTEALSAAEEARSRTKALSLLQPHAPTVTAALDAMRAALADVEQSASALSGLVLEPNDDPDAVLDAAQTHLQFAKNAAQRVAQHCIEAKERDEEETARLDQEQAEKARAIAQLREQLVATGERVTQASEEVRRALQEAEEPCKPLLASLAVRGSTHLGPLERALDALRQHQALLIGRHTNWRQMAEPADSCDDPEPLEALVLTGEAEASFAEADLADLPGLLDTFQGALAVAQAEQQVHDDNLAAALASIAEARQIADQAEALLPERLTIPPELRNEPAIQALEDELLRSGEAARGSLATVRSQAATDPQQIPEASWLDELHRAAQIALRRAEEAAGVHASLRTSIEKELANRAAAQQARDRARNNAQEALTELQALHAAAAVAPPEIHDEAVRERTASTAQALREALNTLPDLPIVHLDDAPEEAQRTLLPLLDPTRTASQAIQVAHDAHLSAIATTSELVACLREATSRSEAAADRAAAASAEGRGFLQGLMGSWPHLAEQQALLREHMERVDHHAAEASAQADLASDAASAEDAQTAATASERAADQAAEVLDAARPLYITLKTAVEHARAEAAEADEHRRLSLTEEARELSTSVAGFRERLDDAAQEAVTALEDSPSIAARTAWEAADELLDGANALLAELEEGLQSVFSASNADEAEDALRACRALHEQAPRTIDNARESALQATHIARKHVAENEQLVVDLQGRRIELDALAAEVQAINSALTERSSTLDGELPDVTEALRAIQTHAGHVADTQSSLAEALNAAMSAASEERRDALRQIATDAIARAVAARNTTQAIASRLQDSFQAAEEAEIARRTSAIAALQGQHSTLQERLEHLQERATSTLSAPDIGELQDATASVERALDACLDIASGSVLRLNEATPETPSRMLEHLVRQGQRAAERLQERSQALEAAIDGVDTARAERQARLLASHNAFVDRLNALRTDLESRVQESRRTTDEARAGLESARPLLGNSPAASARKAWSTATAAVEASENHLNASLEALQTWPPPPAPTATDEERALLKDTTQQLAETIRRSASDAIAEAGAVSALIDMGLRSAEALAGILGDAGAVRGRYQTFEKQLSDRRSALDAAMEGAPNTAASRLHRNARVQIDEIEQTLSEARASLEELGEATSADQAEALLEVASVSLDITESVLEYALPAVDRAIAQATAEADAARVRRERIEAATNALNTALHVDRDATDTESSIAACVADAALLEHHADVQLALTALTLAVEAHTLAKDAFDFPPLDADVEPELLEAHLAKVLAARSHLDDTQAALDAAIEQANLSIQTATELDRARQAAIDAQRERYQTALSQLATRQEEVTALHTTALASAESFPDVAPLEREALHQAVLSITALEAPPSPEESPEAWTSAADTAENALQMAVSVDLSAPLKLLEDALEEARLADEAKRAALTHLSERFVQQRERLSALRSHTASLLKSAQEKATDYPLEAGLPLAALEAAHEAIHAVNLSEPSFTDVDEATQAVMEATKLIDQLTEHDVDDLHQQVEGAVQEALDAEEAERNAISTAHASIEAARVQLQERQEEGRALLSDLAHASEWPEVSVPWCTFKEAQLSLSGLHIKSNPPRQLTAARKAAQIAQKTVTEGASLPDLAQQLRDALMTAETSRREARERLQVALDASKMRIETLRSKLPKLEDLPNTEPARAAHRALTHTLDALEELLVESNPPPTADTHTLTDLADAAEEAELKASARDVEGLFQELDEAIRSAQEAEEQEEAERIATLQQARETVKSAIEALTDGVNARSASLAELPKDVADPRGRRSEARDALEGARSILVDLRNARGALHDLASAGEAISIAFDAEAQQADALQKLLYADAALDTLLDEGQLLSATRKRAESDMEVLSEQLDSVQAILDDLPAPVGPDAEALFERLDNQIMEIMALRATAELAMESIRESTVPSTAVPAADRLRGLLSEIREQHTAARRDSAALREANQAHTDREAAAKNEALAAAKERAGLSAQRADRALEELGKTLKTASERAKDHPDDPMIAAVLSELAQVNEEVLGLVDVAREHAAEATKTADPGAAAAAASSTADEAEAKLAEAKLAVTNIDAYIAEQEDLATNELRDRELELIQQRDAKLPRLKKQVNTITKRLDRFTSPESTTDPELEVAIDKVLAALHSTREANAVAGEALQLLESAKPADIPDFIRDAEKAISATRTAAGTLTSAITHLYSEQEAARTRGAGLALEEARGRAWEACQLVKSLTNDLTRARAALPAFPESPAPRLREAMDRLAEVERRLWRAGQRADEARERAGKTDVLEQAVSAATAAERAIGSASKWERDIDRALAQLTRLLQVDDKSDILPKSQRMRNLRRGRIQADAKHTATPAPSPERDPETKTNPTEALLARLRGGRKRGETGRERLKRLRQENRKSEPKPSPEAPPRQDRVQPITPLDPVSLPMDKPATDYLSLQEFEDYQATTVGESPVLRLDRDLPNDPTEATVIDAPVVIPAPQPPSAWTDEEHTQSFHSQQDDPDFEDAKTQAFSREMIEAMLSAEEAEGVEEGWTDDDGSTRWNTQSTESKKS